MIFVPPYSWVPVLERQRNELKRNARVKPRIRKTFNVMTVEYVWACSDTECYAIGWGATREAAYEQWLSRFAPCWRRRAQ